MSVRSMPGRVVVVVALLLAGAACGDEDSAQARRQSSPARGTTASLIEQLRDLTIAAGVNLRMDDLPSDWQQAPSEESTADDDIGRQIGECLGIDEDATSREETVWIDSPIFESPQGEVVSSRVTLWPSEEEARRSADLLADDMVPDCYTQVLQRFFTDEVLTLDDVPEGLEIGEATVDRLEFDQLGDQLSALRASVPYRYRGIESTLGFDLVVVRVGRVDITMAFETEGPRFEAAQARQLTSVVVERAEASSAG